MSQAPSFRWALNSFQSGKTLRHTYIRRRDICVSKSARLKYTWRVSKSIGLACSWREIYVSNLKQVFTETRLEDVVLSKTQPFKYFLYMDRGNPSQEWRVNYANRILWFWCPVINDFSLLANQNAVFVHEHKAYNTQRLWCRFLLLIPASLKAGVSRNTSACS